MYNVHVLASLVKGGGRCRDEHAEYDTGRSCARQGLPIVSCRCPDRTVHSAAVTDLRSQLQTTLNGTYTLERELGGGGMSRVFVADEIRLGRKVVVKVLSPELAAGISA